MLIAVQRRPARLLLVALVVGSLCGCANDPFEPLAEALLGPKETWASTADAAGATQAPTAAPPGETCGQVAQAVPADVDTAYARVMSRLRFRTLAERKQFAEQYSSGLIDEGFRHVAQPGAYYRLADLVGWNAPGGRREAAWLEVELSRVGIARTRFVGRWCVSTADPRYADRSYRVSLERRLRESVQ